MLPIEFTELLSKERGYANPSTPHADGIKVSRTARGTKNFSCKKSTPEIAQPLPLALNILSRWQVWEPGWRQGVQDMRKDGGPPSQA